MSAIKCQNTKLKKIFVIGWWQGLRLSHLYTMSLQRIRFSIFKFCLKAQKKELWMIMEFNLIFIFPLFLKQILNFFLFFIIVLISIAKQETKPVITTISQKDTRRWDTHIHNRRVETFKRDNLHYMIIKLFITRKQQS